MNCVEICICTFTCLYLYISILFCSNLDLFVFLRCSLCDGTSIKQTCSQYLTSCSNQRYELFYLCFVSVKEPNMYFFRCDYSGRKNRLFNISYESKYQAFCDVTLACDGGSLKCHKIVLAASSDYFQKLFIDNNSEHPIVFLKDVQVSQVKAILDYMYKGEVSVAQQELPALLRVAELLRVKGMIEENKDLKVEKEGERKEGRQGSTDSAPPNSVVPPTSSNGHSSTSAPLSPHPPTSRPLVPPPGAIPPNFRPFLTPPGSTSTPPFPMWPLPGLLPGAYNLFNQQRDRKELSPGPKDRHKMGSGSSSDKDLPLPPLIPRDQAEEREAAAKSSGLNGEGSEDDRTPFPHDPRNPYNNDKSPNSQQYAGGAGHGNNGNMKLEGIAGYVPAQRLEWKRYKQYTRNDIMAAIEEVKTGERGKNIGINFKSFCLRVVFLSPGDHRSPSRFLGDIWCRSAARCFLEPKVS